LFSYQSLPAAKKLYQAGKDGQMSFTSVVESGDLHAVVNVGAVDVNNYTKFRGRPQPG
jgi:hypothetical protein